MKLTEQAIKAIKESAECRRELLYQLEISLSTLTRWLNTNAENGDLTTVKAVEIITTSLGVSQQEILIEEKITA
jgi:LEA14-like dessication related protein